ncbi:hypothetical protein JYU34_007612 [Plutella xylostella]|uniref:SH3 domain-containing protein n=1 Tax=Plutella xylostella TaxID=51655 RepID=A0ABQ7QQX3_PLUXY|nr:hypothetical protein JYU34_007612 [Plutella xylostella]
MCSVGEASIAYQRGRSAARGPTLGGPEPHGQERGNHPRPPLCQHALLPDPSPPYEVLDLLANCRIAPRSEDIGDSEVEYAEIEEMGLFHSTPLSHRHKSKISLTWVLKENLENTRPQAKPSERVNSDVERYQRHNQKYSDKDRQQRKCGRNVLRETKERVVGRNEYYHNLKFKSACELQESGSEGEEWRRRRRHRHRRRKKRHTDRFGYDIRDLDSFLSEASIDRPGNIPVVIAYPTTLYQRGAGRQGELPLALGTVVNAVCKNQLWLYAQTPHGHEGYVLYSACLPLPILPHRPHQQKKTPCWESSTDIYPQPCGNLTDTEKEHLRGRTKSESRYRPKNPDKTRPKSCAEEDFDNLYLKTKSVCSNIDKLYEDWDPKKEFKSKSSVQKLNDVKRQTLLVVNSDFTGSSLNRTLSVQKGDVVVLVQGRGETDVDAEWFYVRKRDGSQGFIPAIIAGNGYI